MGFLRYRTHEGTIPLGIVLAFRILLQHGRFHKRLLVERANFGAVLLGFDTALVRFRHTRTA